MAIKKYGPTTPGRRGMTVTDYSVLSKVAPERSLLEPMKKHSGRNNTGRITVRHQGGGNRTKYRVIDFKRQKTDMPATVKTLEYDPNRSAFIALVEYTDGVKSYIIAPDGLKVGDVVTTAVDPVRRAAIMRAHTATHLLDKALRTVLGDHVHQAGSLVEPDRLRFDFTHFEAITPDQLHQVEELVNDAILEGYPVVTEVLPIEEAKKKGAVAMFGEKYGDTVRVVEMGDVSIEFCGGTHVDNTAKAGPFRVKSETSVASGVRRIEATCGKLTLQSMERSQGVLHKAAQFLKTAPASLLERMEQQASEMKQLRQTLDKLKSEASLGEAKQFLASAKTVKGLHVITTTRTGMDTAAMRTMGDFLRDKDPSVVAVIASINGEKVSFLAACGKEAVARGIKAGDLVRAVSAVCGGKGGGKPDSAMGGGTELLKVDDALASVDDFVSEKLS